MSSKITAPAVRAMKAQGRKIVSITAYDAPTGAIADQAGVDIVLVGDSVGNVSLGFKNTLPVTMEHMLHHTEATARGVKNALLIADMPFGSYQIGIADAVDSAVALMKIGAEGVKLEGAYIDEIKAIVKAGIPCMGHVGMTPQSYHSFGGHRIQGKGDDGERVMSEALAIEQAGAFAIVLELIPVELSAEITKRLHIPTIGIGAGPHCDGQIQVFHDVVGLTELHLKHAKRHAEGWTIFKEAIEAYSKGTRD
ncbi:MAG: 3-methyl-2-oxobutanoate hydroxymethyltransferase [Fimbriimonadaceae bacterium]|nr:3-methyl-2-oxobutanoate hydroxymethyltransferase [Fimbriimonadaceae bacterium]